MREPRNTTGRERDPYAALGGAMLLAARATELVRGMGREGDKWSKTDETPVTVADLASQAILLGELARLAPEESVYAEEETISLLDPSRAARVREVVEEVLGASLSRGELRERIGHRGPPEGEVRWFVDPLDGTKGFVRGLLYAVAVARVVGNTLDRSWLAVPGREDALPGVAGRLYRAERGRGETATMYHHAMAGGGSTGGKRQTNPVIRAGGA
ncbi:MAG TPA: hypothetical protein ENI92_08085, partial [Bacteroidetes bacterium]|nr:hypothetical protein [Bacteroidota bacterium]